VVAVADTAREVVAALDKAEPDRFRTLIFEASIDYDRVQFIGGW